MPTAVYWTPTKIDAITTRFIQRWRSDPNTPASPLVINEILGEMKDKRRITALVSIAGLKEHIEKVALRDHQELPPKLGAGGALYFRNPDGTIRQRVEKGEGIKSLNGLPTDLIKPPPAEPAGTRTRVRWDDGERAALHRAVMQVWRDNPAAGLTVESFTVAMHKCLPKARWRHLAGHGAIGANWEQAIQEIQTIVSRGFNPPAPVERPVPVPVPIDPLKVLADIPLPKLAAVLAEREMELRLAQYGLSAAPASEPLPTPKASPAQVLMANGTDAAHVEALLPRILVVGFRGHQDTSMRQQFAHKPVILLPSIDPSIPPDATLLENLPKDTRVFVETQTAPDPWRRLVIEKVKSFNRESCFGPSRVLDHIKDAIGSWCVRNSEAYKAWQAKHA